MSSRKILLECARQLAGQRSTARVCQTIAAFASPKATHACIGSFSRTDFRDDLKKIDVPTLIIHGDSDRIVPLEVSGARTHDAVRGSHIHIIKNGPHGCNLSHAGSSIGR
jgi:pimeloyl-ACP methyl ester carboxylesterase